MSSASKPIIKRSTKLTIKENRDDLNEFMKEYRKNIQDISRKTALESGMPEEDLDETILNAEICWMVTDNIRALLKIEEIDKFELKPENSLVDIKNKFIKYKNKPILFTILQDGIDESGEPIGSDHHFAVIMLSNDKVAIVEHLETECNSYEVLDYDDFISLIRKILSGKTEDRFYHQKIPHMFKVWVFTRKNLTEKVIDDYVKDLY
jgi:hypothetical protein